MDSTDAGPRSRQTALMRASLRAREA